MAASVTPADRMVELRVLDGPNVDLAGPAIQLRLDVGHVVAAADGVLDRWRVALDMDPAVASGEPGTPARRAFAQALAAQIVRLLADGAGLEVAEVVAREGWTQDEVIVAFGWQQLGPAEELGRWTAFVLGDLVLLGGEAANEWSATVAEAVTRIQTAEPEELAHVPIASCPAVGITGTNGKTTTTRLLAHLAMTAGHRTAWNSTDGVYVDGIMEVEGDYAGFAGTTHVLETKDLGFAVLEMARGGLLNRGMGIAALDVAVVTNVTADHLGLMGIDTLDQLARVKSIPARMVRPGGWAVLNADDPRVLAMAEHTPGRVCTFGLDATAPGIVEVVADGGWAVTVIDDHIAVLRGKDAPDLLVAVADVPLTLAGLARHNLANALAATAAALCAGLDRDVVIDGLRTFAPDDERNPARLNVWRREGVTIVVDIAHNEASYESLFAVCRGLCAPEGRLRSLVGAIGDRTPDIMRAIGEVAARDADEVLFVHKHKYLRDADTDAVVQCLQDGAARAGRGPFPTAPDELSALDEVLAQAQPGDVVAFAVHDHITDVGDRMRERGATAATPDEIAALAKEARPA